VSLEAEAEAQLLRLRSGVQMTHHEHSSSYSRIRDGMRSIMHASGRRTQYPELQGSSQASSSYPCSSTAPPPGTWVHPSSYFSARGPPPFVPMGPPPPMSFAPMDRHHRCDPTQLRRW